MAAQEICQSVAKQHIKSHDVDRSLLDRILSGNYSNNIKCIYTGFIGDSNNFTQYNFSYIVQCFSIVTIGHRNKFTLHVIPVQFILYKYHSINSWLKYYNYHDNYIIPIC